MMIYSCFNPKAGLYDYYEGPDVYPINADLPVPSLPPEIAGIGVPSIEAARSMPSGVTPAGQGWHARGMLVSCGRGPLGELPTFGGLAIWRVAVALGLVSIVTYYSLRGPKRRSS